MELTHAERLILWNQYEIRKHLDPNSVEHCEKIQEALESGYQPLYGHVLERMEIEVISAEKAKFVYDVFDMFDALQRYERSSGQTIDNYNSKFRGFDGHGDLCGFAEFNVKKLRRWEWLNITEFDAHMPIEQMYQRMLDVWMCKPPPGRFALTSAEVDEILAATVHPDHR